MDRIRWQGIWLDVALVLGLAALTVNRFAPDGHAGDVILYSVMSLQNVTLFFWEQNRLLNVGPLLTSVIRDPAANLYANLLFPALAFFAMIRFWTGQAVRLASGSGRVGLPGARELFVLVVAVVFLVFRPAAVFDFAIWHVEYTLSLLLLGLAYVVFVSAGPRWFAWPTGVALLVVATGVNYSIVLPALALGGTHVWVAGRLDRRALGFSGAAVAVFAAWGMVARLYPGPGAEAYAGFDFSSLPAAIAWVSGNILQVLYTVNAIAVLVLVAVLWWWSSRRGVRRIADRDAVPMGRLGAALLGFGLGWLVVFSGSTWVVLNEYHFRYFAMVLFAAVMLISLGLARVRLPLGRGFRTALTGIVLVGVVGYLARPFVPLEDYAFVQRVDALGQADTSFYAGDFNLAWAAVMRGLLRGEDSLGVAERASGNGEALRRAAQARIDADGVLRMSCLKAGVAECVRQANTYIAPLELREARVVSDRGHQVLALAPMPPRALRIDAEALARLPGLVGRREDGAVVSDGRRGFLLYGPYEALPAGDYRLRVFGEVDAAAGGHVELVSGTGRERHAVFPLAGHPDAGAGVVEGMVSVTSPIRDAEIRIFVTGDDRLRVTGYELVPISGPVDPQPGP